MIILWSDTKLEPGTIYHDRGVIDFNSKDVGIQPFFVMRESSYQEYLNFCKKNNCLNPAKEGQFEYFYEVLID
jgi:hypothetical protein